MYHYAYYGVMPLVDGNLMGKIIKKSLKKWLKSGKNLFLIYIITQKGAKVKRSDIRKSKQDKNFDFYR